MIAALRESGGEAVAIPEDGHRRGAPAPRGHGLFVEPTSATAAAALDAIAAVGRIGARERVVVVLSGSGLKAASKVAELVGG